MNKIGGFIFAGFVNDWDMEPEMYLENVLLFLEFPIYQKLYALSEVIHHIYPENCRLCAELWHNIRHCRYCAIHGLLLTLNIFLS